MSEIGAAMRQEEKVKITLREEPAQAEWGQEKMKPN